MFHSFECGRMSSWTRMFRLWRVGGPIGIDGERFDSHGSSHTFTDAPLPTVHPRPVKRRSRPQRIPLHPWEPEVELEALRKGSEWQYFLNRVWPRREFGSCTRRQAIFARRAWLKHSISLNPRPPRFFGRVSLDQDTQHIFLFSGLASHQKRVSKDCICLQREAGSMKHDIA